MSFYRKVTFIERTRHCFYRFWEFCGKFHFGQNYARNILYSIYRHITLIKLGVVGHSMQGEPWMFLFTDFALSKNKRFSFKQGDCHFLVFSVSSVCILISTSNKYRSFSYLDICRYFGVVRTTPAVRFDFIISSS